MSADHQHSGFEIPPDPGGRPIDHELLGKFVGAAFDRCTRCQNALLTLMVDDPAAIARLVGWTCVSTRAAFGGLPAYLIQDGVPGPATPEFRQLARLTGATTAMISACEDMTSYQRCCAVHTAIDILVDNLHLSRRQRATTGLTVVWRDLYATGAAHLDAAAGYYNNNVRVDTPTGPVNVRIPLQGAEVMDLRLWREEQILPAITGYIRHAPRLLHASDAPRYQVHEFIDGPILNTIAPRGVPVPAHVPADVVALLAELTTIPREKLPATPAGWPRDDDTITFARHLSGLTQQIHATYRDRYGPRFQAFGFPADPLAAAEVAWPSLTGRPLVCVHSDIHRKNMIIKGGESYFLDWELALWGDPVYDLAVHFHKMGYTPAERDQTLHLWQAALPPECTAGWEHDLDAYLAHEQIKSAIVDTVRYSHAFTDPGHASEPDHVLVDKLTVKLNNAYRRWGITDRVDSTIVEATLRE